MPQPEVVLALRSVTSEVNGLISSAATPLERMLEPEVVGATETVQPSVSLEIAVQTVLEVLSFWPAARVRPSVLAKSPEVTPASERVSLIITFSGTTLPVYCASAKVAAGRAAIPRPAATPRAAITFVDLDMILSPCLLLF